MNKNDRILFVPSHDLDFFEPCAAGRTLQNIQKTMGVSDRKRFSDTWLAELFRTAVIQGSNCLFKIMVSQCNSCFLVFVSLLFFIMYFCLLVPFCFRFFANTNAIDIL